MSKLKRKQTDTKLCYPCRVCSSECTMEQESIQCDDCHSWLHQHCIQMTLTQYVDYSDKAFLQFYCWRCCCDDAGRFNFLASLSRIASRAPDVSAMRLQAESELKLLTLYKVMLPSLALPSDKDITRHPPSVSLLQHHSPWLLQHFAPAHVGADGNCLFRAVSLALYGDERAYAHLRLLSAIEALLHPSVYDARTHEYYGPFRVDDKLVLSCYDNFVAELSRDGSYSDMLTVLVLSTVIQKPIQTRWPISVRDNEDSPLTKLVVGRGVETVNPVNVLWSTNVCTHPPQMNHFVPLIALSRVENVVQVQAAVQEPDSSDEQQQDVDDSQHEESLVRPSGHPLNGHFLSNLDCVTCLRNDDFTPLCDYVSVGVKENVMFKAKMLAGKNGGKFWDDCGAWIASHGKKTYHMPGELTELRLDKEGAYAVRRKVDGQVALVTLDPQPHEVVVLHRLYSKLRRDCNYQRRITYMDGCDCYIAEYLGDFPDAVFVIV